MGQSERRHDFIIYSLHSLCIYARHTGVSLGYMLLNNTFGFPADTQMYGWDGVCACVREDLPLDNTIIIHVSKGVRPSEIYSTLLSPDLEMIHGIHSSAQRQLLVIFFYIIGTWLYPFSHRSPYLFNGSVLKFIDFRVSNGKQAAWQVNRGETLYNKSI